MSSLACLAKPILARSILPSNIGHDTSIVRVDGKNFMHRNISRVLGVFEPSHILNELSAPLLG